MIKDWLREHYAPAWRYQQIIIDVMIILFGGGFALPAAFIVWRMLWRAALSC